MILILPGILNAHEVAQFRQHLDAATWQDGRVTAGSLSAAVKDNQQLEEDRQHHRFIGPHDHAEQGDLNDRHAKAREAANRRSTKGEGGGERKGLRRKAGGGLEPGHV